MTQARAPVLPRHGGGHQEFQRLDVLGAQVLAPEQAPVGIDRLEQVAAIGGDARLDLGDRGRLGLRRIDGGHDRHRRAQRVDVDLVVGLADITDARMAAREGTLGVHAHGLQRPGEPPDLGVERAAGAYRRQMAPELLGETRAIEAAPVLEHEKREELRAATGLEIGAPAIRGGNVDAPEEGDMNHRAYPPAFGRLHAKSNTDALLMPPP